MPCLRDRGPHIMQTSPRHWRLRRGWAPWYPQERLESICPCKLSNFDIFLLEANTCNDARRLWRKEVKFEILICLCRTDNIGWRSFQREWSRQFSSFLQRWRIERKCCSSTFVFGHELQLPLLFHQLCKLATHFCQFTTRTSESLRWPLVLRTKRLIRLQQTV